MHLFYTVTSLGIVVLVSVTLALIVKGRRTAADSLMIAFLSTILLNFGRAVARPILDGMPQTQQYVGIGDLASRLVAVSGYICLLLFALKARSRPSPHDRPQA